MAGKTKIEWCDATWNAVRGCSLVSTGCTNCYAMRQAHRMSGTGGAYEGLTKMTSHGPVWTGKIKLVPELLDQPLRWQKPRRIFVNSMSDLFHEDVPVDYIALVFSVMATAKWHIFQVLTKRPQRMQYILTSNEFKNEFDNNIKAQIEEVKRTAAKELRPDGTVDSKRLRKACFIDNLPLPNVWLGVSVEGQATADERIPLLLQTPAAVRWVSAEPLLRYIDLKRWLDPTGIDCPDVCPSQQYVLMHEVKTFTRGNEVIPYCSHCGTAAAWTGYDPGIDWVVAGGESGPQARPMHPDWARSLRDQCQAASVPFFMKQWGEWTPTNAKPVRGEYTGGGIFLRPDGSWGTQGEWWDGTATAMDKVGKKAAGRLLDERTWDEYP